MCHNYRTDRKANTITKTFFHKRLSSWSVIVIIIELQIKEVSKESSITIKSQKNI